jgi:type I restriction enzyme, S subunit
MKVNWNEISIGKVGKVVTGKTPSSKNPHHFGKEMPFVTPSDFGNYHKYIESAERYLSSDGIRTLSTKVLPPGSIIVSCIGSDMGKVAVAKVECITNQQINSIICNEKIIYPNWVFYCLKNSYSLLRRLAGDGTTMPIVNKGDFEKIKIPYPPLPIQRRIAEILGALDDKIECNRRINKTLEQMAMALYKHWFVDFGPFRDGEFVDSELGLIPKGWEIKKISEICTTQYGYTASAVKDPVGPRFLRLTDMNKNLLVDWQSVPFCRIDEGNLAKYRLKESDILVSRMADPGKVIMADGMNEDAVFASYLIRLNPNHSLILFYLYYLMRSEVYQNFIKNTEGGTVQKNLNAHQLTSLKIVVPSTDLLDLFNKKIEPIRRKQINNQKEIDILARTRDYLLPKLLSGEIEVNDRDRLFSQETYDREG